MDLSARRALKSCCFMLVGFPGRARTYHQTRGAVGIIVHIPGHTACVCMCWCSRLDRRERTNAGGEGGDCICAMRWLDWIGVGM